MACSLAIYQVTLEARGARVVKQSCSLPELHASCEGESDAYHSLIGIPGD